MRVPILIALLPACTEPLNALPAVPSQAARVEVQAEPGLGVDVPTPVPTCSPAPVECGQEALDPARCVTDPSPFVVTVIDGFIADVHVDQAILGELALAEGAWWAAFPDPMGGCEWRVVQFEIAGQGDPS